MADEIKDMSPGIAVPTPNNQAFYIAKTMEDSEAADTPAHGELTETRFTQWVVAPTDTDIALDQPAGTAVVGSVFLIEQEWMTVSDISNVDNPAVERTAPVEHPAGAEVEVYGPAEEEGEEEGEEGDTEGEGEEGDEDTAEEKDEEPARKPRPTPSPPAKKASRTTAPPHHSAVVRKAPAKKAPAKKKSKR